MKIDLDKQYLEEYENNLTLREMYDFVKEHLQAQGVDQEYVWEQPRVFNIVYSQNKENRERTCSWILFYVVLAQVF